MDIYELSHRKHIIMGVQRIADLIQRSTELIKFYFRSQYYSNLSYYLVLSTPKVGLEPRRLPLLSHTLPLRNQSVVQLFSDKLCSTFQTQSHVERGLDD